MPDLYTGLLMAVEELRQKDTAPAFDPDTDSLEAISERLAAIETILEAVTVSRYTYFPVDYFA
jgi:hypothetical protein